MDWTLPTLEEIRAAVLEYWSAVSEGFTVGFALGFVLPVGIILLWAMIRHRRHRSLGIEISGEKGDLYVTVAAIREFLTRIVSEFGEAQLKTVDLRRRGNVQVFRMTVDAVPGTDLVALQQQVTKRVLEEAGHKLGLDPNLVRLNMTVHRYSADSDKIARQTRKIVRERYVGRPLPAAEESDAARPVAPVDTDQGDGDEGEQRLPVAP